MKKRILKRTSQMQYLYPNNANAFLYSEDYYTIFEGDIDGTKILFYQRTKSLVKQTEDGGKTFTETNDDFIDPSYFVAIDTSFEDIQDLIVPVDGGILEWVE